MPVQDVVTGLRSLCQAVARLAGVEGATVSLFTPGGARARVTANALWAPHLDELQFAVGEGPCFAAFDSGEAVEVEDLGDPTDVSFPSFAQRAAEVGAVWVLALPVGLGDEVVGVLDVASRRAPDDRPLVRRVVEHTAPLVAEAFGVLGLAAGVAVLSDEMVDDVDDELGSYRWVVHQAVGFLHARDGVETGAALARLRAAAFVADEPLERVAERVLRDRRSEHRPSSGRATTTGLPEDGPD